MSKELPKETMTAEQWCARALDAEAQLAAERRNAAATWLEWHKKYVEARDRAFVAGELLRESTEILALVVDDDDCYPEVVDRSRAFLAVHDETFRWRTDGITERLV